MTMKSGQKLDWMPRTIERTWNVIAKMAEPRPQDDKQAVRTQGPSRPRQEPMSLRGAGRLGGEDKNRL